MRYQLPDGFVLDLTRGCLLRGEQELHLKPKAFETLVYLAEHSGWLVSKQELLEVIWKDVYVTEGVLVQAIAGIREALGDSSREPHFIKTAHRRGYMFIGPVQVEGQTEAAVGEAPLIEESAGISFPVVEERQSAKVRRQYLLVAGLVGVAVFIGLGIFRFTQPAPKPLPPIDTETHARLGQQYLPDSEYQKAVDEFQAVLRQDPKHATARRELARLLLATDQYAEAARLLEADSNTATDARMPGVIAWAQGDYQKAESYFSRLLEPSSDAAANSQQQSVSPQQKAVGLSLLASLYLSQGDLDHAEQTCRKGLSETSRETLQGTIRLRYLLGVIARLRGDHKRSEREMREVAKATEGRIRVRALLALGGTGEQSGEKATADEEAQAPEAELRVQGPVGQALPMSALVELLNIERLIVRGDKVQAIAQLGGLLARFPKADSAMMRLARLKLAQLYERRGEMQSAREQYEQVVRNRGVHFYYELLPVGVGSVTECLLPAEAALKRLAAK